MSGALDDADIDAGCIAIPTCLENRIRSETALVPWQLHVSTRVASEPLVQTCPRMFRVMASQLQTRL